MKDIIYRDEAIDTLMAIFDKPNHPDFLFTDEICNALNFMPSAQPEIIRCRDCQNYYFADNRIPQEQRYVCSLNGEKWNPDDYCSYAERRTDETD